MNNKRQLLNIVSSVSNERHKTSVDWFSDISGIIILIAMGLKVFGLLPLIVKINKTGSAKDVSLATPIMYLIAFVILGVLSFMKEFYVPLILFAAGIIISIFLIVQIDNYEKKRAERPLNQLDAEIQEYPTKFTFPNPIDNNVPAIGDDEIMSE